MQPKHWYALLLLLLIPVIVSAQTGKIRGKVVDETSKEALIGANIVVEGTSMGAASDVNGEFLIINVPGGEYTLKASYVGYKTITVSGIRVNLGLTTEQNFSLPGEGVAVPTVQIVAERPLVNKNATSAVRIANQVDFEKLPARGINSVIALQPGIITIAGNFYARGSRSESMTYSLEGAPINDPVNGGRAISLIQESLEEVQVMVGNYTAEFGGSNGAIVRSQLRTGGERWKFTMMGETNQFASAGSKVFGAYQDNTSESVLTGGGPITENIRFFASGRYAYDGPGDNTWDQGFNFGQQIALSDRSPSHPNSAINDTINYQGWAGGGRGGYSRDYLGAATLKFDFKTTQLQLSSTFRYNPYKLSMGWGSQFLDQHLATEGYNYDGLGALKLTQFIDENTLLDATVSYTRTGSKSYDPDFKDNLWLYGDSTANAKRGVAMLGDNYYYNNYTVSFGTNHDLTGPGLATIARPGTDWMRRNGYGYSLRQRDGYDAKLNFSTQLSKSFELKLGGEYNVYTHRRYDAPGVYSWAQYRNPYVTRDAAGNIISAPDPTNPNDSLGQYVRYQIRGNAPNILGYDLFGNLSDKDVIINAPNGTIMETSAPLKPQTISGYVQTKVELKDIVINAGLRYDYFNSDCLDLINRNSVTFNDSLKVATQSNFVKSRPLDYLQPRFGFAFPVTDKTVFHAQFGRYVELQRLAEMSNTPTSFSGILAGGFFYTTTVAFGIAPQRSTQYEIGFQQQVADFGSVDVTAFYKDETDKLQYAMFYPIPGAENGAFPLYVNSDFSTNKGLEFKFTMRRTSRVLLNVNYTLSDARTTGSSTTQNNGIWGAISGTTGPFLPRYVQPATFNMPHRGTIQLDYRFNRNDGGPILEQLGANILFTFHSGTNWTRLFSPSGSLTDVRGRYPVEEVGASMTPWAYRLDGRIDKTFDFGDISANVYIYVVNILNSKIPITVQPRTGDVFNDGFLQTVDGRNQQAVLGADGNRWSQMYDYFNNSVYAAGSGGRIEAPRSIRVGMQLLF